MKTIQQWIDDYHAGKCERPRSSQDFYNIGVIWWRQDYLCSNPEYFEEAVAEKRIREREGLPATMSHFPKRPAGVAVRNERKTQPDKRESVTLKRYCESCNAELPANTRPHKKTCGTACRKALSRNNERKP